MTNSRVGFLIPGFPRSVGKWQVIKRHRAADWARHCYVTCMESENKNAKKQCHYCSLASRWIIKEWTCYTVRVLCIYIVYMSILSLIFFQTWIEKEIIRSMFFLRKCLTCKNCLDNVWFYHKYILSIWHDTTNASN